MGRLKRKRPASPKKRARKRVAKKNGAQQAVLDQQDKLQGVTSQEGVPAPRQAAPKKGMPKPIKPTGRRSEIRVWAKTAQFLREVKVELKKVTWPSKKEAMASTVVVIILVMIVSAFLGLVDVGLSSLIRVILH